MCVYVCVCVCVYVCVRVFDDSVCIDHMIASEQECTTCSLVGSLSTLCVLTVQALLLLSLQTLIDDWAYLSTVSIDI